MNEQEAIQRIKEHNLIHSSREYPRAVYITEAFDIAITALEKQTPKKIQKVDEQPYFRKHYGSYTCPVCRTKVMEKRSYCHNCGQRLKW